MTARANRWLRTRDVVGDEYDARYDRAAAAGQNVHGEAGLVMRFAPASALDAGCGTGRVARELARRGIDVVGVDLDEDMLATARRKSPELSWHRADLTSVRLGRTFDVVLAAGNVMILLAPGTETVVVANLARHLCPGGLLIAGFQLAQDDLDVGRYDGIAMSAGLTLVDRWSTWEQSPWDPRGGYAVSVHRSAGPHEDGDPAGG